MSWETRGMALELMSLPIPDEFMGTLPSEDDLWRNTLNIPTQRSIQNALKKSVQGRGLREQNELDIVWKEVWKPELLQWFQLITPDFISQNPQFASCLGRYWHPLLTVLWETHESEAPAKPLKKVRKISTPTEAQRVAVVKKSVKRSEKTLKPATASDWDYPFIRYSPNVLKLCWDEPLTHEARADLWSTALKLLAPSGDTQSTSTARQFIGKLIKEFGEKNTAAAVGQLVVRPVPPADPKSFLRKQLKNMTEGSPAVKQANRLHVHVPL